MSQHLIDVLETTCGTTAPLELIVLGPGCEDGARQIFEHPFALVGRDERCDLRLEDDAVSRRHAYLQQLGGRIFCVDLGSRTGIRWGGEVRPAGWLRPEQGVQIGPFTLELAMAAQAGEDLGHGNAEDWDPLQDRAGDPQLLPHITVEMDNKVLSRLHMNRALVLVGSSPACRIRLRDGGVSRYHCSLVRTPQGIWVVDLLFGDGTSLNGQSIRHALVKEGDRLQVGPYVLRVSYPVPPSHESRANREKPQIERPAIPTVDPPSFVSLRSADLDQARQQEIETLRQQLADSQARCAWFRDQTRALDIEVAGMADLQAQLESAEARAREFEVVRGERDRWQAEAQDLQARLAAAEIEREEWQQRLETAEASARELVIIRGERDCWQAERQEFRAKLATVEAEREEVRQRLEAVQQQLVEEREAGRATDARLDEESATLQRVRDAFAALKTEHDAVLQRLQEAQDELALGQNEAHRFQTELAEAQERQRDSEALRQELADFRAEHDQLCARVPELEDRANAADHLQTQLHDAEAETERLRVQLRDAEAREAELETVRAECERFREQAHALEVEVAKMADLQARLESAETSVWELEVVRGERDHWQSETQNLQHRLAATETEREEGRQHLETSEARLRELEIVRGERDHWQVEAQDLQARLAAAEIEREEWQQRLETAEASARELDIIRGERDRWQAEAHDLQAGLTADSADEEQFRRLTADLHATQMERDQLLSEQQLCRSSAEQARARVSDLERALAEAAAAHEMALEEARVRWESERQALQARFEQAGQGHQGAVQAAIREIQARVAAEREALGQQLEGAERQLVWEREMFQEQIQQLQQQVARLQAERHRLAGQPPPVAAPSAAMAERSLDEARRVAEPQQLPQQDARELVFAQLSAVRSGHLLQQPARAQHPDALAELVPPRAPVMREQALVAEQRRLAAIAQEIQAGWGEVPAGQERLGEIGNVPDSVGQASEVDEEKAVEHQAAPTAPPVKPADAGEASAPSDSSQDAAIPVGENQPAKGGWPEARPRLWRQILGLVRGK